MKMVDYYNILTDMKSRLNRIVPRGIGCNTTEEFNKVAGDIVGYRRLSDYILADLVGDKPEKIGIGKHRWLEINVNSHGVGYILGTYNDEDITNIILTSKQLRTLLKEALLTIDNSLAIITSPHLVDYIGNSNTFDYESIIELLNSTCSFLDDTLDLTTFNLEVGRGRLLNVA